MRDFSKYQGVIPAFYACYDDLGAVSATKVRELTRYLIGKGVKGLYVGGSSGECIYQSVEERKLVLENVMAEARGKVTIIAHVACNNTSDSQALAAHAESLGVDAIAAIPPIYFHLPDYAIAKYWNDISAAAPNTDFIIYNGPDEQFLSGLAAGAIGGIGGTYAVMPELYLKIYELYGKGEMETARQIQNEACRIIYKMCTAKGNLYAVQKAIIRLQGGPDAGSVRLPMPPLADGDASIVREAAGMISAAIGKYC